MTKRFKVIKAGQLDSSVQPYYYTKVIIGNEDKSYIWIGNPYWGGLHLRKDGYGVNIHLQGLLMMLGVEWKVRFLWFSRNWALLLWGWIPFLLRKRQ